MTIDSAEFLNKIAFNISRISLRSKITFYFQIIVQMTLE